jgi:DNA recombination protein RmuC
VAVEHDPTLLDFGVEKRVLLATPLTLISLLMTVAHGWRQQALANNIDKVRESGLELNKRLSVMHGHFTKLGDALEKVVFAYKAVFTYNDTIGSLEKNVLPQPRRFRNLRPANANGSIEGREVEAAARRLDSSKWLQPAN